MALKIALAFLATINAVRSDSAHDVFYKSINSESAHAVAAAKGRALKAAIDVYDRQGFWFTHFTIGASPDLEILIDTGSADAILNPGIYEPSANSVDTGRQFRISYATTNPDGSGTLTARGDIYRDLINQHGANLTVRNQHLGAITSPKSPPTFPSDGLIGYAGINSSALRKTPFIHSLCDQGTLTSCRFGLAFKADKTGKMYYGTVGTEEFSGALTSVHIDSEWEVTGGVSVNGKTFQQEVSIITDSGTTIIFGPTQQVRSIFDVAGIEYSEDSNGITGYYSCNSPPDIGFVFGGKTFNILDSALAFKMDGGNCTASIHGTSDFGDSWLVGQAFFQGKYVDHNIDDGTMGFANLS